MRSATLLLIRMNAAETSASSAMAPWTPLTVVSRSSTTAEIDTFMIEVSTTRTNIAIASSSARRALNAVVGSASVLMRAPHHHGGRRGPRAADDIVGCPELDRR